MAGMAQLARWLILFGVVVAAVGVVLLLADRLHVPLGHLPGDIVYRGRQTTVYFPWVTMLVISLVLTILLNLFRL